MDLHDLDIEGKESNKGVPYILNEVNSVRQALQLYLSYSNDRLYYPEYMGVLKRMAFKQMTAQTLDSLAFDIRTDILNGFTPNIEIEDLQIIPDKQNRILELFLTYRIVLTNTRDSYSFSLKNINMELSEKFTYQEIDYTEENLLLWVRTTKYNPEVKNKKLIFNYEELYWVWGKYKLINFDSNDSYFSEILMLING